MTKLTLQNAIENGNDIKKMAYSEYKKNYSEYPVVEESYNDEDKTIEVVIPNYDKKLEIAEKLVAKIAPEETDTKKVEFYKKGLGEWLTASNEQKKEAIKVSETVLDYIDCTLTAFRSRLGRLKRAIENLD